ncbi:hypothetical protein L3X38_017447 [Prunus dulcis]|uniref:Uncharacterized protein n=1 Tax=Prunus dulcis TaxID=3755 RepID=A0AAD4W9R2_PRUDU|nr:hypothetical protein L3X38_017447 [Prunus dulcis]
MRINNTILMKAHKWVLTLVQSSWMTWMWLPNLLETVAHTVENMADRSTEASLSLPAAITDCTQDVGKIGDASQGAEHTLLALPPLETLDATANWLSGRQCSYRECSRRAFIRERLVLAGLGKFLHCVQDLLCHRSYASLLAECNLRGHNFGVPYLGQEPFITWSRHLALGPNEVKAAADTLNLKQRELEDQHRELHALLLAKGVSVDGA